MTSNGLLVILSGPSGAGKGTILKCVLSGRENAALSISATTRSPRAGEEDGKDYYFISKDKFSEMNAAGEMLESAEYCGNFYGTPAAPIKKWTSQGVDVILEIEVKGGKQVKKKRPDSVGIFILPPSLKVLEQRLRKRGTESDEVIQKRLLTARREISEAANYDYIVINDNLESAAEQVCQIINSEKHRFNRNKQLIERMLKND